MSGGDITVVAGGWSVRDIRLDRLCGRVIGVNDAAYYLTRVDVVVSMDRLWAEHRWDWLCAHARETWLRRSAVQNVDTCAALEAGWLNVFDCDHESTALTDQPGWLNGTNSGLCAINLAWQCRPARVFLLGFDMCRDKRRRTDVRASWYPHYPWAPSSGATSDGKYARWARQFDEAARQFQHIGCDVWNVSPLSAIPSFRKMTPAQFMRECEK